MSTKNSIRLIGNIGQDPETKFTQSGKTVTKFSLGVSRDHKRDDEERYPTDWFNCEAWGDYFLGAYFCKGARVCIVGEMEQDEYEDREGNPRKAWRVKAQTVIVSAPKEAGLAPAAEPAAAPKPAAYNPGEPPDITDPWADQ
jgi:single-strand DNA-binding protein